MKKLRKGTSSILAILIIFNIFSVAFCPIKVNAETYSNVPEFPDFDMDCYVADLFTTDGHHLNKIIEIEMNSESPNKVIKNSIENNSMLMAEMTAWQVATFQPNNITNDTVTQIGYYEAIILSALNTSITSSAVKTVFENVAVESGKNLYSAFTNILKGEYALEFSDTTSFNSLSSANQKSVLSSFDDAFKKQYPKINDTSKFLEIFELIVKSAKSIEECMGLFTSYYQCSLVNDYLCQVVTDLYEQCPDTKVTMKAALLNISSACLDSELVFGASALDAVYRGFDVIFGFTVDSIINNIVALHPAGLAAIIIQSVSKGVSNFLFSTDAICENYYKMCCLDEFEKLLRSVTKYEMNNYKNNKTKFNANCLFTAVGLMFSLNELSCDYAINYAKTIYEESVCGIFLNKKEYENFTTTVNNIRQLKQQDYSSLMTHYIFFLEDDYPEVYAAYMELRDEIENPVVNVTGVSFPNKHMTLGLDDDIWFFWNNAEVSPSNATNRQVTYTSSDESIVSIIPNSNTLKIELHKTGTVTITATSVDGGYTDTFTIDVVEGYGDDGVHLEDPTTNLLSSGSCGSNVYWNLYNNGLLKIYGSGKMNNHSYSNPHWHNFIKSIKKVVIYDGVTSIGDDAFHKCTSLTSISIPDSVTSIGYMAFENCTSLTSITIGNSVTSIGSRAFSDCSSLTNITIPDSVTSIGSCAFYSCSSLTSITIPDSVTSIDECAFSCCRSLESITIPDSVTSIGSSAFEDCTSLTNVIIGNGVTGIGSDAFRYCKNLTSVTIGNSVTSIGSWAFSCCRSLESITIPDSVTSIGYMAFENCTSLTSITIGNSVTSIGGHAFSDCSSLTNITIPDSVTSINNGVFYNCTNLTSVTIPDSVKTIYDYAFYNCTNLKSITIPDSVIRIGSWAFIGCTSLKSIIVEKNNPIYDSRNNCNALIKTADNALIASCSTTVIPDSVTSIGGSAFYNCINLTSITIPDSVTSIGSSAFSGCERLTSITIPGSVTSIGNRAFNYCSNLKQVYYFGDNFNDITIGSDNSYLLNANIIYLKLGDTDRDNTIGINDVTLTQMYIADLEVSNTENNLCADVNGDGEVNVKDVTLIQMYLADLIEEF